jgi:hypothetical protein
MKRSRKRTYTARGAIDLELLRRIEEPGTIAHCEALVKNYRTAADNFTALAKKHASMAARVK